MEVLIGVVVLVGIPAACYLLARWRLQCRNRVHPKVPTPAPLRWLVAPSTGARLHRRLQTTVRVASIHAPKRPLNDVARHAVELDRRIVLAARRPLSARGPALRQLADEVDELDRLALAAHRPFDAVTVGDPVDRLTALAEARAEVDALDHTLGS